MRSNLELSNDRRDTISDHDDRGRRVSSTFGTTGARFVAHRQVLGGHFRFASNSRDLIDLVEAAYGGLPPQVLPAIDAEFRVELCLLRRDAPPFQNEPPAPRIHSDSGEVFAVIDASNYVAIEPALRRARVVVSEDMLQHAYHLRYELIEFAVFILAARGIGLVPLHAACVGRQGRGVLLLGDSGSGKSTLVLHCLLHGLDVLAEDAVFVCPANLLATGVPNYLHLRPDALHFTDDDSARRWIAQAPVIRRRSGVEKFEVDLRQGLGRPAEGPLEMVATVLVSAQSAGRHDALLTPLGAHEFPGLLSAGQPYAPSQPGWQRFQRRLVRKGGHRLQRGHHPRDSVDALRRLLD